MVVVEVFSKQSEALSLPDREAGGKSPEWFCHKFIADNISELIEVTAMVVLQLWCFIFISIFEDYDDQIWKNKTSVFGKPHALFHEMNNPGLLTLVKVIQL